MLKTLSVLFMTFYCYDCYTQRTFSFTMPNVRPEREDTYLCTPVRVNYTKNFYIVGFEPQASMNTAHHILLYGCLRPGSSKSVWNCGEMSSNRNEDQTPCSDGSQIIYAWARDAPKLILPEGVGFKVGGDTDIQYLVLQVHYVHVDHFKDGLSDSSGINLFYTEKKMPKQAAVLLLGIGRGEILPNSTTHMEVSCTIKEDKVLHPFAFRTHTHNLGRVVSGYRVRPNIQIKDYDWDLIGKRNPLDPQMFYPVHDNTLLLKKGDLLAARCTMHGGPYETTYIGSTNKDEMCNFYLMYWVEGTPPLEEKLCFGAGPPDNNWRLQRLSNIPADASTLP